MWGGGGQPPSFFVGLPVNKTIQINLKINADTTDLRRSIASDLAGVGAGVQRIKVPVEFEASASGAGEDFGRAAAAQLRGVTVRADLGGAVADQLVNRIAKATGNAVQNSSPAAGKNDFSNALGSATVKVKISNDQIQQISSLKALEALDKNIERELKGLGKYLTNPIRLVQASLLDNLGKGVSEALGISKLGKALGEAFGQPIRDTTKSYVTGISRDLYGRSAEEMPAYIKSRVANTLSPLEYERTRQAASNLQDEIAKRLRPAIFESEKDFSGLSGKIRLLGTIAEGTGAYLDNALVRRASRAANLSELFSRENSFAELDPTALGKFASNLKSGKAKASDFSQVALDAINDLRIKEGLEAISRESDELADNIKKYRGEILKNVYEQFRALTDVLPLEEVGKLYQVFARPLRRAGFLQVAKDATEYADAYTEFLGAVDKSVQKTVLAQGNGKTLIEWGRMAQALVPGSEVVVPFQGGTQADSAYKGRGTSAEFAAKQAGIESAQAERLGVAVDGYSESLVRLYAVLKKLADENNSEQIINLLGYSMGSNMLPSVMEFLGEVDKELAAKIRPLAIGTEDFLQRGTAPGLTPNVPTVVRATDTYNPNAVIGKPNQGTIPLGPSAKNPKGGLSVAEHNLDRYVEDAAVLKIAKAAGLKGVREGSPAKAEKQSPTEIALINSALKNLLAGRGAAATSYQGKEFFGRQGLSFGELAQQIAIAQDKLIAAKSANKGQSSPEIARDEIELSQSMQRFSDLMYGAGIDIEGADFGKLAATLTNVGELVDALAQDAKYAGAVNNALIENLEAGHYSDQLQNQIVELINDLAGVGAGLVSLEEVINKVDAGLLKTYGIGGNVAQQTGAGEVIPILPPSQRGIPLAQEKGQLFDPEEYASKPSKDAPRGLVREQKVEALTVLGNVIVRGRIQEGGGSTLPPRQGEIPFHSVGTLKPRFQGRRQRNQGFAGEVEYAIAQKTKSHVAENTGSENPVFSDYVKSIAKDIDQSSRIIGKTLSRAKKQAEDSRKSASAKYLDSIAELGTIEREALSSLFSPSELKHLVKAYKSYAGVSGLSAEQSAASVLPENMSEVTREFFVAALKQVKVDVQQGLDEQAAQAQMQAARASAGKTIEKASRRIVSTYDPDASLADHVVAAGRVALSRLADTQGGRMVAGAVQQGQGREDALINADKTNILRISRFLLKNFGAGALVQGAAHLPGVVGDIAKGISLPANLANTAIDDVALNIGPKLFGDTRELIPLLNDGLGNAVQHLSQNVEIAAANITRDAAQIAGTGATKMVADEAIIDAEGGVLAQVVKRGLGDALDVLDQKISPTAASIKNLGKALDDLTKESLPESTQEARAAIKARRREVAITVQDKETRKALNTPPIRTGIDAVGTAIGDAINPSAKAVTLTAQLKEQTQRLKKANEDITEDLGDAPDTEAVGTAIHARLIAVRMIDELLNATRTEAKSLVGLATPESLSKLKGQQSAAGKARKAIALDVTENLDILRQSAEQGDETAQAYLRAFELRLPELRKYANKTGQEFVRIIEQTVEAAKPKAPGGGDDLASLADLPYIQNQTPGNFAEARKQRQNMAGLSEAEVLGYVTETLQQAVSQILGVRKGQTGVQLTQLEEGTAAQYSPSLDLVKLGDNAANDIEQLSNVIHEIVHALQFEVEGVIHQSVVDMARIDQEKIAYARASAEKFEGTDEYERVLALELEAYHQQELLTKQLAPLLRAIADAKSQIDQIDPGLSIPNTAVHELSAQLQSLQDRLAAMVGDLSGVPDIGQMISSEINAALPTAGEFDFDSGILRLRDEIDKAAIEGKLIPEHIETIVHELRHATQLAKLSNLEEPELLTPTPQELQAFAGSLKESLDRPGVTAELEALENDAYTFAHRFMGRFEKEIDAIIAEHNSNVVRQTPQSPNDNNALSSIRRVRNPNSLEEDKKTQQRLLALEAERQRRITELDGLIASETERIGDEKAEQIVSLKRQRANLDRPVQQYQAEDLNQFVVPKQTIAVTEEDRGLAARKRLERDASDRQINDYLRQNKAPTANLDEIQIQAEQAIASFEKNSARFDAVAEQIEHGSTKTQKALRGVGQGVETLKQKITDNGGVTGVIGKIGQGMTALAEKAGLPVGAIGKLGNIIKGVGIAALAYVGITQLGDALVTLGRQAFETYSKFELLQARLKFVGGGDSALATDLKFIREESDRLKIPVDQLAESFTALRIATKDTALEGRVQQLATSLGTLGRVYGLTAEQSQSVQYQLGQTIRLGRAQGDELRSISEAGINVSLALSKSLGKSTAQINDLLEKGQISAEQVTDALVKLADEAESGLPDALENSVVQIDALKKQFADVSLEVGERTAPLVVAGVTAIGQGVQLLVATGEKLSPVFGAVAQGAQLVGDIAAPIVGVIGAIAGAVGKDLLDGIAIPFQLIGRDLTFIRDELGKVGSFAGGLINGIGEQIKSLVKDIPILGQIAEYANPAKIAIRLLGAAIGTYLVAQMVQLSVTVGTLVVGALTTMAGTITATVIPAIAGATTAALAFLATPMGAAIVAIGVAAAIAAPHIDDLALAYLGMSQAEVDANNRSVEFNSEYQKGLDSLQKGVPLTAEQLQKLKDGLAQSAKEGKDSAHVAQVLSNNLDNLQANAQAAARIQGELTKAMADSAKAIKETSIAIDAGYNTDLANLNESLANQQITRERFDQQELEAQGQKTAAYLDLYATQGANLAAALAQAEAQLSRPLPDATRTEVLKQVDQLKDQLNQIDTKSAEQRIALAQNREKVLEKIEADRVKRAENDQKVIENQVASGVKTQIEGEVEISQIRQREIQRRLDLLKTQIAGETDASGQLSDIGKNLFSERKVLETELTKVVAEEANKRYEAQLKYVEQARDDLTSAITLSETQATQAIQEAQNQGLLNQDQVETQRIALTKERLTKELALEYANIEQLQALPDPADPEKAEAHQKQIRDAKLKTAQLTSQLADQEFKAQEDLRKAAVKAIDQQAKGVENAANAVEQLSRVASGALDRQNKLLEAQKSLRSSIAGLVDQEYKILIDTTKDEDIKAKLQEKAAKARLDALTQSQAIERQILDLQLKQEEVQSRVAIIKSTAALEKAKAEEQKVNLDPNATQADKQAAAIGVSAAQIELQGNIAAAEAQQQLGGIRQQQQAVDQRKDSLSARFDLANATTDPDKKERAINRIRNDAARDIREREARPLSPIGNRVQPDYSQVDVAARQLGLPVGRGAFRVPEPVDLHSGATQAMQGLAEFNQGVKELSDLTRAGVVGNLLKIVDSNKTLAATLNRILERPRVQQTNNNNYSPRFGDPLAGTGY